MAPARRDARSEQAKAYRHLYGTARWKQTRAMQLAAYPLCRTCQSQNRLTPATVCNHLDKEAKATEEGFFAGPFSSECADCHDQIIQRDEVRIAQGKLPTRAVGADGWPL